MNKNLTKSKFFLILVLSVLLMLTTVLGASMFSMTKKDDPVVANAVSLSSSDITAIENRVRSAWEDTSGSYHYGSPTSPLDLGAHGGAAADMKHNGYQCWYYLSDSNRELISSSGKSDWLHSEANIRIVLNGYAFGNVFNGTVGKSSGDKRVKFQIFDSIPGYSNYSWARRNPNPWHYYKYDSSTGGYTMPEVYAPAGCTNVTDMPTFQANTYVAYYGSVIGGYVYDGQPQHGNSIRFNQILSESTVFIDNVAIIGVGSAYANEIFWVQAGSLYLSRVTMIGNGFNSNYSYQNRLLIGATSSDANVTLIGCTIYGNYGYSDYMRTPYNGRAETGIGVDNNVNLRIKKCDIGMLYDINYSNYSIARVLYMKGAVFNDEIRIYSWDLNRTFNQMTNVSGRIQLINTGAVTLSATCPNLELFVYGNSNSLTVSSGYTLGTAITWSANITIRGTVNNVYSQSGGNIYVEAGGTATIRRGYTASWLRNYGTLNLDGNVSTYEHNSNSVLKILSGNSYTLASGKTLLSKTYVDGTLNVNGTAEYLYGGKGTVNVASGARAVLLADKQQAVVKNAGTLTVNGTIADLRTNSGTLTINSTGNVTVKEGNTVAGTVNNSGIFSILGAVSAGTVNNSGTLSILGAVSAVVENKANATTNLTGTLAGINNIGTLSIQASTANVENAIQNSTGTINIASGVQYTIPQSWQVTGSVENNGNLTTIGEIATLNNNGTLTTIGEVTTLNNNGNLTAVGEVTTLNNEENAYVELQQQNNTDIVNNKGTMFVNRPLKSLENSGRATVDTNANIANVTNSGEIIVEGYIANLLNTSGATAKLNSRVDSVENNGTIIIASLVNSFTNNGRATVNSTATVKQLTLNGIIEVMGKVQSLTFTSGQMTLTGQDVVIEEAMTIPRNGILRVGQNVTVAVPIINSGSVTVERLAKVSEIDNSNLLVVDIGAFCSIVKVQENATAEISGKITSMFTQGTVNLIAGCSIDNLTTNGTTKILKNASVTMLTVEDGYTDILDDALVFSAKLKGGTLEIRRLARGLLKENCNFEVEGRLGTLIDHRGEPSPTELAREKVKNFFIIGGSVSIGLLLVIAVIIIIIAQMKKKKKFKLTQGGTNQELIPVVAKGDYADNRKAVKRGYKEFKTDLKSRVRAASKVKYKK